MQTRSLPLLLMMVSSATAVFPVCRSPMINSRCPRPIGIILSMAFSPVAMGSRTGCRSITPGASRSRAMNLSVEMGPLSSMGRPSESTTRPIMASPTGTLMMRPVRFTSSPSFNSVYSPRITTPTWSSSRFMAMPATSCGKDRSSPAMTLSSPYTRAMPSPSVITVPVSSTEIFDS